MLLLLLQMLPMPPMLHCCALLPLVLQLKKEALRSHAGLSFALCCSSRHGVAAAAGTGAWLQAARHGRHDGKRAGGRQQRRPSRDCKGATRCVCIEFRLLCQDVSESTVLWQMGSRRTLSTLRQ